MIMISDKLFNYQIFLIILLNIELNESFTTSLYWNIPTIRCNKREIDISPKKYRIVVNKGENFFGENIVLLYEKDIGLYPYYKKINSSYYQPINGGIPQKVDYKNHLNVLQQNIERIIPNKYFKGLAILDLEKWRIVYETNWNEMAIYKKESYAYEKSLNATLKNKEARELARINFDRAAFKFFEETIKLCKKLRPKATWGFYDLTICNEKGDVRGYYCFTDFDDKLLRLYKHVDAIFPSPYLNEGKNYTVKEQFVKAVLKESQRLVKNVKKKYKKKIKMYAFNKFEINPFIPNYSEIEFYDPYYLCITYGRCVEELVDGIIIWSTTKNLRERCPYLREYVRNVFGPYVESLRNTVKKIFKKSKGRKVLILKVDRKECKSLLTYKNISDWCETGFYGPNCLERKLNSSGIIGETNIIYE